MSGKEKISKSISVGLIVLVFLFLTFQFILFIIKVVQLHRVQQNQLEHRHLAEQVEAPTPQTREQVTNTSPKEGASKPAPAKFENVSSAPRTDPQPPPKERFLLEKLPAKSQYTPKPKVELNSADTTSLKTLYGIGSYYAKKIVEYRQRLGGSFVCAEQLMEIYGIDSVRYAGFEGRVYIDTTLIIPINLYTMPIDSMAKHPYIGKYAAKGIDRYRRSVDSLTFTIDGLVENGILHSAYGQRLKLYSK